MTSPATNRQFLLELAKATLEALHSEPSSLESVTDVHPDAVKNSLEAALDWARLEESAATLEAVAPSTAVEPYIPYNQTLSLLESAYDEYIESCGITELPFYPSDRRWKTIAEAPGFPARSVGRRAAGPGGRPPGRCAQPERAQQGPALDRQEAPTG